MSNQTYKRHREDAAKKRREYLQKKAETWVHGSLGFSFAVVFLVSGLLLIWFAGSARYWDGVATVLFIFGGMGLYGIGHFRTAIKDAKSCQYVPPVAEQIAALPADEILLRGSDLPDARPDELLRAAQEGAETGQEELLRAGETSGIGMKPLYKKIEHDLSALIIETNEVKATDERIRH